MSAPRVVLLANHVEERRAFWEVVKGDYNLVGVVTLDEERRRGLSGGWYHDPPDGVSEHSVSALKYSAIGNWLHKMRPDVFVALGSRDILSEGILEIPTHGVVGAHAANLPHGRGGSPVNWAILQGWPQYANCIYWMRGGIDNGPVLDRRTRDASPYDTCRDVYRWVERTNAEMVTDLLDRMAEGEVPEGAEQTGEPTVLGRRAPEDGNIDWSRSAREVYDLVRAVAKPYPGARTSLERDEWRIWDAACLPTGSGTPGEVLGPVVSPCEDACGLVVACGSGALLALEVEHVGTGETYKGRRLAELPWTGKVFR